MGKTYSQYCGIAKALDLLGERWTLLIARELLIGPRRYSDLLEALSGITTNLLSKRLKEMESHGLIKSIRRHRQSYYQLSEVGEGLEEVLFSLGKWGWQFMGAPKNQRVRLAWASLSFRRRLTPLHRDWIVYLSGNEEQVFLIETNGKISSGYDEPPTYQTKVSGPDKLIAQYLNNKIGPDNLNIEGDKTLIDTLIKAASETSPQGRE